jgi:hypothetical protein
MAQAGGGFQQLVDLHVQCGGEGVQVGVHWASRLDVGLATSIMGTPCAPPHPLEWIIKVLPGVGAEGQCCGDDQPQPDHDSRDHAGGGDQRGHDVLPAGADDERSPLGSRIIAARDAFTAMTHQRPYAAQLTTQQALAELHRCADGQFDPKSSPSYPASCRHGHHPANQEHDDHRHPDASSLSAEREIFAVRRLLAGPARTRWSARRCPPGCPSGSRGSGPAGARGRFRRGRRGCGAEAERARRRRRPRPEADHRRWHRRPRTRHRRSRMASGRACW